MPSRREQLLDAAIGVLGNQGSRALTHRAVDAAAAMPFGSTANYYKTREALISAVVERFAERDRAGWETVAAFVRPSNSDELAAALTAYVQRALGPDRAVTVARYGLFLEATLRPDLQETLAGSARELRRWAVRWLEAIGTADPAEDCEAIFDYIDGLILHRLAFTAAAPDGDDGLATAVRRTIRMLCSAG
ncbi:TetR/AcrR family transcriptional regulator [Actinoplanes sp. NPDC023714]|uniref:TetR/AcrR family transcriptional regulator n=1 Tax=Actinoplanes sp. NPDC023714 TaxID=3154322 RepID=UPI0034004F0B